MKKDTLINIGADLRLVPPKPYSDDGNYVFTTEYVEECTYVPDDAFERYLIDLGYDDKLDDFVKTENLIDVTSLKLFESSSVINDLTGIEGFKSLEILLIINLLFLQSFLFQQEYYLEVIPCQQQILHVSPYHQILPP